MADLYKTYPSWMGLALAPPACAFAGWRIALRTQDFTELQGIVGGALAGVLAGLIIWAIDRLRKKSSDSD